MAYTEISGKENVRIKRIIKLQTSSRYRREEGVFVLEGLRTVEDAFDNNIKLLEFYFTAQAFEKHESYIEKFAQKSGFVAQISESISKTISDTFTPQGIFAVAEMPEKREEILEKGKYILLSAHREENIDTEKNFLSLFNAINKMAEKYDMPILYSCHPRSRNRLVASGFKLDPRVIQHEPLGFHDYNCLQMNAFAVVSDSGTLPEESSFFTSVGHSFPAVCIRTSTERPEALDKGCFILAGINEHDLLQAVDTAVEMVKEGDNGIPVPNYVDENVSTKVVKLIQSYTGVVNKMVWRKE